MPPFQKGKSGNPRGRKEGTKVAPEFLRDLRHVYGSNKPAEGAEPEPPGRAMLRELKEKDPARFLERLQRAEREWAAAKQGFVQESAPEAREAVEDDPGTMAALGLVEKVLKGVLDGEGSSKEPHGERSPAEVGGREAAAVADGGAAASG